MSLKRVEIAYYNLKTQATSLVLMPQGFSKHKRGTNQWLNVAWQDVTDIELAGKQFVNMNDLDFNGTRIGIDQGTPVNGQPNLLVVSYRQADGTPATIELREGDHYWQNKVIYDTMAHYYHVATGRHVAADEPLYRSMNDNEADEVVIVRQASGTQGRPTEELRYAYRASNFVKGLVIVAMIGVTVFALLRFSNHLLVRMFGGNLMLYTLIVLLVLAPFSLWLLFKRIIANKRGQSPLIMGPQGIYIEHAVPDVPTFAKWSDVTAVRQNIRSKIEGQRFMNAHDHYYVLISIVTDSGIVRSLELDEVTYQDGETIYDNMRRYWEAYR